MTTESTTQLDDAIGRGLAGRDRANMGPTIGYFRQLLAQHPGHPLVLFELAGAHDAAGQELEAVGHYEQALTAGLDGDVLRRCLLQYGSTLRILQRHDQSLAALLRARQLFPESDSVRLFLALSLHAAGNSDRAVAELLELAADRILTDEVQRYQAALRGNADHLREQQRPSTGTTP